ncbi:hypothetical protein FG386_003458 [Cryptosporidium ryanae]|uniref:uncharacterized protein n=1 Tax=Cryptosporidium ryanae TaxID=515981 RepID=UPI00351A834A|nr:hypothetical protein FG386_003458 [Cryptosporidium ryanae]
MLKLKKQPEKGGVSLKPSDSTNKTSQAVKIMAHLKDLDKMIKNGGKKEKKNKALGNKKKRKLASVENQITSLKIISRMAAKVRDREVERQPFMDYSPDIHPHITTKNVDKLLCLETNTLATGKSLVRNNILHERETLQKMRGVCIYIKAKLPGAVEKFKGKNELKSNYKDQKIIEKKNSQTKYVDEDIDKDKNHMDPIVERDRKIEIDITTIHSILGLSGLELLGDIDTSDITRIRHKLIHVKESINSMIPEISSDYVIKGLTKFDPDKIIGLVPMLLSVVKNKYVNPNFWASVAHELWLFLVVFQHDSLKIGDNSTELLLASIKNSSKNMEERLDKIHLFPDYFIAVSYLFSGMIDTKIPGVLRLMVRLNIMYYFECRINSLILFCKSPMELWVDGVKLSALLSNIDSIRTLLTALSESKCIDMQQIVLRIFSSNLVTIILYHLVTSPINLVNEKNNVKLIVCFIEFLNECLLIGHSKELLNSVSNDNFVNKSIINNVFGYGYVFYSELDANNIHLDKKEDLIVRDYKHNQYSYSKVGYYNSNMSNKELNENYNIWDVFSLVCTPKYSESILYPIILFLADIMYFSFIYEISFNFKSLKSLLLSIKMLYKHFRKTTMVSLHYFNIHYTSEHKLLIKSQEVGSDESLSSVLLEDTKTIKKYLKLLFTSQNIDLKKVQEWITDRRIKVGSERNCGTK